MNYNTLMFKTHKVKNEAIAEQPFWVANPILGASVGIGQVAQAVAAEKGVLTEEILCVYRLTENKVAEMLRSGRNVNFELVGLSINLKGKFGSKDEAFDPARNVLEVSAYAKPILRDCLKGVSLRNVTSGLKASVFSVTDDTAFEEGVVTAASRVLVAGVDILITAGKPDEGVWVYDSEGELAVTPTVLANTVGSLDLDFGELPPDGEYSIVVKARSGASDDYAPATARKSFTVRRA